MRHYYEEVTRAIEQLRDQDNVARPDGEQLRRMAEPYGVRTHFGNVNYSSCVRNRSKDLTVILGGPEVMEPNLNADQQRIIRQLPHTLKEVHRYIQHAPLVGVARTMGCNSDFSPHCTMYVSTHRKDCIRIPYMWYQTLFDPRHATGPEMNLVFIPEWQEKDRQALVFPEIGVTYVLGTDYFGEAKKGFLRMAMWFAKSRGMLGLHAGSKLITARTASGKLKRYGVLLLGLTATGKPTHSAHTHDLDGPGEEVKLVQDDVVFLRDDASALGSEAGLFIKTDSLEDGSQPVLYEAAKSPNTVFENCMVDYLGRVYMADETLTGNARAVVRREDLGGLSYESLDQPPVDELAKLIIVGDEAFEGNRFYEILCKHEGKIDCYQLNTGGVGEILEVDERTGERNVLQKVDRVAISEMAAIFRGVVREEIEWEDEPVWGTQLPKAVASVNLDRFDPSHFYSQEQIDEYVAELRAGRIKHLEKFEGLHPGIVSAFKL